MFVEVLGWIAAAMGSLVALPQVVHIVRANTTAGVSALTWQLLLGVNIAWTTHGAITHHANIVVHNLIYAVCTSTLLILLRRDRAIPLLQLFAPGILLGTLIVAVDIFAGPFAFAVTVFLPAALSQFAQLRSLVMSPSIQGVSLLWLGYNVVNMGVWLSWSLLAAEVSVTLVATAMGTLMTLNLILAVLRRLDILRARLPLSDG